MRASGGSRLLVRWLAVAVVAGLAGFLVAALVPDRYTATTVLALAEGRGLAPVGDSPSAAAAIIASPELAREVVARLGAEQAAAIGASPFPPAVARLLGRDPAPPPADAYRRALDLAPRDAAGVLAIGVSAGSAEVAARAANTSAQVYLERRAAAVAERDQALGKAVADVAAAQAALAQAIDRAAAFRADPAAPDTARRARAAAADLALLVAERAALVGERDAIARRLLSVENLRGSGNLFDAPFEGVHLLRHLVEQRLTLRADLAAERRIREARDWRVRALAARADDLDDQIAAATGSARDWLASEREHLTGRIAGVEGAIHLRQAIIAAAADNDRRQNDLDRAVDAARDRLALAREQLRDESVRVRDGASAARVLTLADAPAHPDSLHPALAGAAAALMAGFLAWHLTGRGRDGRDVAPPERVRTAVPASAGAPAASAPPGNVPPVAGSPISLPPTSLSPAPAAAGSPLASVRVGDAGERALEALLARLAIPPREGGARHVAVVGGEDRDAGVAVARALARHLARQERVVLVDLATPAEVSATGSGMGFADLIAGRASFSEIITREPGSRLHRVGRGAARDNGPAGDTILLALAALDQTYDWIVSAAPQAGAGEVAEALLGRAQGVVLVADGDAIDTAAFARYEALRETGAGNIVIGLAGVMSSRPARPSPSSG